MSNAGMENTNPHTGQYGMRESLIRKCFSIGIRRPAILNTSMIVRPMLPSMMRRLTCKSVSWAYAAIMRR